MTSSEIIFEVTKAVEGRYNVQGLGYSIFTPGEGWADLKAIVRDAVLCHFEDDSVPKAFRLRPVKAMSRGESGDLVCL